MAATSSTADGDYFPVGSLVTCVTILGVKLSGEVLGFDNFSRMLAIKSLTTGGGKSRVQVVNTAFMRDIRIEREPSQEPLPVPLISYDKIRRRTAEELNKKKRSICPPDVSPDGQRVFSAIRKTIDDVSWEKDSIVVLKSVVVCAPSYNLDSISIKSGAANSNQAQQTLMHVQKIVEKFYSDKQPKSPETSVSPLEQETSGLTLAQ